MFFIFGVFFFVEIISHQEVVTEEDIRVRFHYLNVKILQELISLNFLFLEATKEFDDVFYLSNTRKVSTKSL